MDNIEALTLQRQGPNPDLGRLWEHLESLTPIREGGANSPRRIPRPSVLDAQRGVGAAPMEFVEGFGRKFSTQSTRHGPFRGMTYTEVERAIGRLPNLHQIFSMAVPLGLVLADWSGRSGQDNVHPSGDSS